MTFGSRRIAYGGLGTAGLWLLSVALVGGQAPQAGAPTAAQSQMAEEVFKNVQVLKGIPVDEFMGTMGVFSAALGMSCEDCHTASSNDWANYAKDASPRKQTARRMVADDGRDQPDELRRPAGRDVLYPAIAAAIGRAGTASLDALYARSASGGTRRGDLPQGGRSGRRGEDSRQVHPGAWRGAAAGQPHELCRPRHGTAATGRRARSEPWRCLRRAPAQRTTIVRDPASGDSTTDL